MITPYHAKYYAYELTKRCASDSAEKLAGAGKMVDLGSGSAREVSDYHLSRFACYLIAQNGDPKKPEIAKAKEAIDDQVADRVPKIRHMVCDECNPGKKLHKPCGVLDDMNRGWIK